MDTVVAFLIHFNVRTSLEAVPLINKGDPPSVLNQYRGVELYGFRTTFYNHSVL
jgi:hypothetical protein